MRAREPITRRDLRNWGGYIDCHFALETCLNDAICFIDGNPYCERHAQIVEAKIAAINKETNNALPV